MTRLSRHRTSVAGRRDGQGRSDLADGSASAPSPSRAIPDQGRAPRSAEGRERVRTLGVELGETGVTGAVVVGETLAGDRAWRPVSGADPERWAEAVLEVASRFDGRYDRVGIAVGSSVRSRLGAAAFGLGDRLRSPAVVVGAAQATAWAEHRHGAGAGRDLAYLDVGAGVDGALVLGGRLATGHRGPSVRPGLMPDDPHGAPIESLIDAGAIARLAGEGDPPTDAQEVLAAARARELWAEMVLETSAAHLARLCTMLRYLVDPELIVIGGEVGGADQYVERVRWTLPGADRAAHPTLAVAALGADAALLGAADLARRAP